MNSLLRYTELPDARQGDQIRKVERLARVSYMLAARAFEANGGNVERAIKAAKAIAKEVA